MRLGLLRAYPGAVPSLVPRPSATIRPIRSAAIHRPPNNRPMKSIAGTIRGDFSLSNRENLVHGSDSPESAAREIALWFPELG